MAGKTAVIVGAGNGISGSFARQFAAAGGAVVLAARNVDKLTPYAEEIGATCISCDATKLDDVDALFTRVDRDCASLDVVLYNASARAGGPFTDVDAGKAAHALNVSAYGGFLVAQHAARRMEKAGAGTILFTGASASVKGYKESAVFAMGKFALRGLAQSIARELAPKGVHVAHFVIDGGVRSVERGRIEQSGDSPDRFLNADAIAETYMHVVRQPRSAWTWEIELRPWVETF
ncbi:MAG: SDR family NAD(P)-dependent oxidoreductase [Pseudomonadota bacterium]